jgi:hypothetical protein
VLAGAAWASIVCAPALSTPAGAVDPVLSIVGGTGILGGTVAVVIELSNDADNAGVSADLDIDFPADVVEFIPPVSVNCRAAARLSGTHQVGGTVPRPGLLRFAIFNPTGLETLGNGELATCDFHIPPNPAAGIAALTPAFVDLTGAGGGLPVTAIGGTIVIANFTPPPTPPVSPTPVPSCLGDCNADGSVTMDELVRGVAIAVGSVRLTECPTWDLSRDGMLSISELISAVKNALQGCERTS